MCILCAWEMWKTYKVELKSSMFTFFCNHIVIITLFNLCVSIDQIGTNLGKCRGWKINTAHFSCIPNIFETVIIFLSPPLPK